MTDKKPELSAAMKGKVEPKVFKKNPINGTKFTIAISSAKGELVSQHLQQILL